MTNSNFSTFAASDMIQAIRRESFEYRHQKAVDAVAAKMHIAELDIKGEYRAERRARIQR